MSSDRREQPLFEVKEGVRDETRGMTLSRHILEQKKGSPICAENLRYF
jgi:hypothetical protein